jgi:DNA-binding FadR family transcriptional regulator
MEARAVVEETLAGLAAERGSAEEILAIKVTIAQMREDIAAESSILEADMSFHLAVATAAHNEVLRNAVQLLRNITRQWLKYKVQIPNVAATVLKRHEAVYRAIASRNPNAARLAMRKHLQETQQLVIQIVEKHGASR